MNYSKKINPALVFCSSFLLMSLTGCGGGEGFAHGPKTAVDTPLTGETNALASETDLAALAGITFIPSSGEQIQADQQGVAISGLEAYATVCISKGELHPVFAGEDCIDGLQFNTLPGELVLPLGCEADGPELQSHALKISALTPTSELVLVNANYTRDCSTSEASGVAPSSDMSNRLNGAVVASKPDFTTREEINVSYSIGFTGQYTPSGETMSVFPAGAIAPDCTLDEIPLTELPVMESSGAIALPSQLQLGNYQLQMRDQNGCHIGAPTSFNIIQPEVLVARLVNGLDGYSGSQDTTITELGPWHTIPLGGDDDNWVYNTTPDEGELITLIKWDIPENISGLIQQVALQFDVKDASTEEFTIHAMNAPWSEDTAIWDNVNLAANQDNAVLGTIRPAQIGLAVTQLNETGVALVQSWVDGDVPNYGFVLRAPSSGVDGFDFQSNEESRIVQKPALEINYVE